MLGHPVSGPLPWPDFLLALWPVWLLMLAAVTCWVVER